MDLQMAARIMETILRGLREAGERRGGWQERDLRTNGGKGTILLAIE
jgi:hypothetical protein